MALFMINWFKKRFPVRTKQCVFHDQVLQDVLSKIENGNDHQSQTFKPKMELFSFVSHYIIIFDT